MHTVLDTQRRGAVTLVVALGVALLIALTPYATGLIAIPVLYVALAPAHLWLARRLGVKGAASVVVLVALLAIVVLGVALTGLIVGEAERMAGSASQTPIVARLSALKIGPINVGEHLADLGAQLATWMGSHVFGLLGSASRFALNLLLAFFGLFYLLLRPGETWDAVSPYIPFSASHTDKLRQHFLDVTKATLLGTGLSAVVHGALVGVGFRVAELPNAALWGVVTMASTVVPVLGAGVVWIPGAATLLLDHRPVAAILLALWGLLVVGNVDYLIRPMVSRRWGHIHPFITLVGALVAVPYFGILGLLIGPLALSYFFELINMYREEYVRAG